MMTERDGDDDPWMTRRRRIRSHVKLNGEVDDGRPGRAGGRRKANVITIEVTAEDGTTKQTYTVTLRGPRCLRTRR